MFDSFREKPRSDKVRDLYLEMIEYSGTNTVIPCGMVKKLIERERDGFEKPQADPRRSRHERAKYLEDDFPGIDKKEKEVLLEYLQHMLITDPQDMFIWCLRYVDYLAGLTRFFRKAIARQCSQSGDELRLWVLLSTEISDELYAQCMCMVYQNASNTVHRRDELIQYFADICLVIKDELPEHL